MKLLWRKAGLLIILGMFALTLHAQQTLLTPLPGKELAPSLVLTDIKGVKPEGAPQNNL